ncbi:MAG: hypothetical protein ABI855_02285 [Bacteroidota bacterium]
MIIYSLVMLRKVKLQAYKVLATVVEAVSHVCEIYSHDFIKRSHDRNVYSHDFQIESHLPGVYSHDFMKRSHLRKVYSHDFIMQSLMCENKKQFTAIKNQQLTQ